MLKHPGFWLFIIGVVLLIIFFAFWLANDEIPWWDWIIGGIGLILIAVSLLLFLSWNRRGKLYKKTVTTTNGARDYSELGYTS